MIKSMKSEELIRNNALTNIEVINGQQVVFLEIALTAAMMAKNENLTEAEKLVIEERQRQLLVKGFKTIDDDVYVRGELAVVAACYAIPTYLRTLVRTYRTIITNTIDGNVPKSIPNIWPKNWSIKWWKPTPDNRIRELVKAGALILAEIERLQRLDLKNKTDE